MKIVGISLAVVLLVAGGWYLGKHGGLEKPVISSSKSFSPESTIPPKEPSDCSHKTQGFGCTVLVNGEISAGSCQYVSGTVLSCLID